tara:strand:- start:378 stop:656 length:279 start_codon:yes stop_codon:yes gene_type:complete
MCVRNGKNTLKNQMQSSALTPPWCYIQLQKFLVGVDLHREQIRHLHNLFNLAERMPLNTAVSVGQSQNSLLLVKAKAHGDTNLATEREIGAP